MHAEFFDCLFAAGRFGEQLHIRFGTNRSRNALAEKGVLVHGKKSIMLGTLVIAARLAEQPESTVMTTLFVRHFSGNR